MVLVGPDAWHSSRRFWGLQAYLLQCLAHGWSSAAVTMSTEHWLMPGTFIWQGHFLWLSNQEGLRSESQLANETAGENRFLFLDYSVSFAQLLDWGGGVWAPEKITLVNVSSSIGWENKAELYSLQSLKTMKKSHFLASWEITATCTLIMSWRKFAASGSSCNMQLINSK